MKLFLFLLLFAMAFTVNGEVLYRNQAQPEAARLIQNDASGSIVEFNLIDLEIIEADMTEYGYASAFRIPTDGDFLGIVGSPDLPVVRRMVLIPNYGDVELEMIHEETSPLGNYRSVPLQERPD